MKQRGTTNILDYILTVNIFNEGVDIPEINQVIMLRPTESAIIFVQQLGRGLRKKFGKEYVVVLDFIGNYANNFLIPLALSGDRTYNKDNMRKYVMEGGSVIPGCSTIHFDTVSKQQIFSAIDKAKTPLALLKEKYYNLRDRLGRMPTTLEFYQYGEVDPLPFINYQKTSYYNFVRKVDREAELAEFSPEQEAMLDFVATQIADGKRPHELLMLQLLLETGHVDPQRFALHLQEYSQHVRAEDYRSALGILEKTFLNTEADKQKFKYVQFFTERLPEQKQRWQRQASPLLKKNPQMSPRDQQFHQAMLDLIQYGLARYQDNFSSADPDNLVLYQKYSRKDVCRLLNWPQDDTATLFGYRIKHGTCPIFVTYKKKDDISATTKYEDKFIDPQMFSWMTRSKVTEKSPETQDILHFRENNLKIFLFIKKSDGEGTDFYYMGRVEPVQHQETTIPDKNGKLLPIVNFHLRLQHAVRNDIYDYFVK